MRILTVGPSPQKSKGGMATVIKDILNDPVLLENNTIDMYDSYVDGNRVKVLVFSLFAYVKFALTKKDYDIYHIHMASKGSTFRKGMYIRKAKKWGKKVIIHVHGGGFLAFYQNCNEKQKAKVLSILKSADMIIALSEDWKAKFKDTFGELNYRVLQNGVNTEYLKEAITPPSDTHSGFLALGRMCQNKGTYDLLEALAEAKKVIPEVKCYFAGDGDIERVKAIVKEKGLENNAIVIGWADKKKKMELLKKVSTLVLPSYHEGLPMAILECMACGKTIISTCVGAIPEVVKSENGILIDAGNVNALADALIKCSTDLKMVTDMGSQNIVKVQNKFSMTVMHKLLADYYSQVL